MKQLFLLFGLILSALISLAEETEKTEPKEQQFGVKFSGFIKNDFFFDTRQVVAAREGHFLLWPTRRVEDANGQDINARSSFNFLAIQTRLTLAFTGPDALNAKTSALIEGDFFATTNEFINLFRMRHAYIKLNWTNTELLTGQYWNPMFVTGCFPGTISFNTGAPIQGVARNPQIRLTHKIKDISLIAAALSQRDFVNEGPLGKSSIYLRNSTIPEVQAQIQYTKSIFFVGGGIAYKTLVPRLTATVDQEVYSVKESVSSVSAMGFAKITTKPLTIKLQAKYGENNSDMLAISGYAVSRVVNPETGEQAYTPLSNIAFWSEITTNGENFQAGIFAGFIKNNGTNETIDESFADNKIIYGMGHDIESIFRISPHVYQNFGKLRIAAEVEYTAASFGNDYDLNWQPLTIEKTENCRFLLSFYYFF